MKHLLIILFSLFLAAPVAAQKPVKTKKQMKEQVKKQEDHRSEIEGNYAKNKERHRDIQDKKTRRRMKKNQKTAARRARGRDIPFYKRWFQKSHFR